ncbi:MAG: hypothetical protein ACRED1_05995, partial [Limisphaerales bacterium]
GGAGVAPTAANFIKQASGPLGTLDTSFDASKVVTDIYEGTVGGSLWAGAMDGFGIKFGYRTKAIAAADVGIADVVLDSSGFGIECDFAPSNMTEAVVDTLVGYQGASAVLPGQAYGSSAGAVSVTFTGVSSGFAFMLPCDGGEVVQEDLPDRGASVSERGAVDGECDGFYGGRADGVVFVHGD